MSVPSDEVPESYVITHFARDARALDEAAFRAKHGDFFLVRRGALSPERRPARPQRTIAMQDVRGETLAAVAAAAAAAAAKPGPAATPDLVVFPVRVTGRSPFPRMITVGRTKNNDVVLSDIGISKFHAFFREEGGKLLLQDAESRNGTFAAGEPVPTKKAGKAMEIASGAKVKFGLLEFWLLGAPALQDLARRASG